MRAHRRVLLLAAVIICSVAAFSSAWSRASTSRAAGAIPTTAVSSRGYLEALDADDGFLAWDNSSGRYSCSTRIRELATGREVSWGSCLLAGGDKSTGGFRYGVLGGPRVVWVNGIAGNTVVGGDVFTASLSAPRSRKLLSFDDTCDYPDPCATPVLAGDGGNLVVAQKEEVFRVVGGRKVFLFDRPGVIYGAAVLAGNKLAVVRGTNGSEESVELHRLSNGKLLRRFTLRSGQRPCVLSMSDSLLVDSCSLRPGDSVWRISLYDLRNGLFKTSFRASSPGRATAGGIAFLTGKAVRFRSRTGRVSTIAQARVSRLDGATFDVAGRSVFWGEQLRADRFRIRSVVLPG